MTREQIDGWVECAKSILPSRMKGKTIMWWLSFNAVGIWWFATVTGNKIDSSIPMMYGSALAAFVGSKGHELYEQRRMQSPMPLTPVKPQEKTS